jgi:hypothetical protein
MKITQKFNAQSEDWQSLLQKRPWNVFINGGSQSRKEERCQIVFEQFSSLNIISVGINRQDGRHYAYQLQINDSVINCEGTIEFKHALDLALPAQQPLHILLDLTSLELDIILNLLPSLLGKNIASLFGLYLVPESYGKHTDKRLQLLNIEQPRGYISFLPGVNQRSQDAAHFILLGFDKGRAQNFINQYDWDIQQIHVLIGDPSYVQDGVDLVKKANESLLSILPDENIHYVEAHLADNIRQFFCEQFHIHRLLDIIPLGPRPILLGFLLFYLRLAEIEQAHIRILYDFPKPRLGCTKGIAHGYLYDCNGLINNARTR